MRRIEQTDNLSTLYPGTNQQMPAGPMSIELRREETTSITHPILFSQLSNRLLTQYDTFYELGFETNHHRSELTKPESSLYIVRECCS